MANGATDLVGVHHIGITVRDADRSAGFWCALLDVEPIWRKRLTGRYLGGVTGYAKIELEAAFVGFPNGVVLEILEYQTDDKTPNPTATANPGNVHICLEVVDADSMRDKAISLGAKPVSMSVIEVTEGPNAGARACYLRDPDGITFEFFQKP